MPSAEWFKGANVNIVHEIFKNLGENNDKIALSFRSETIGNGGIEVGGVNTRNKFISH